MEIKLNAIYLTFRQYVCQLFSIPANQQTIHQPTKRENTERIIH